MSLHGRVKRDEAMFHVALYDAGYRWHRPSSTPETKRYFHLERRSAAVLERIGVPALAVAATVVDEETGRPVGKAYTAAELRRLLRRQPR